MPPSFTHLFQISRTSMLSNMLDLDTVSHNLSNYNTAGFKETRLNFQELLNERQMDGIQLSSSQRLMMQGALVSTENPLDLAVMGDGFFGVELPDGRIAYTRNGTFHLDADQNIVDPNGNHLIWEGEIPEDSLEVNIGRDGVVYSKNETTYVEVGRIGLYRFTNPGGMLGYGESLWLESENSGEAVAGDAYTEEFGQIIGFSLERSNTNLGREMVHLVTLQRSFEVTTKVLQQTDQMLGQAVRMRQG